ncbi:DUF4129 domain-containing transglutaminase family protein [Chloroflexota bacterium]
MFHRVGRTRKHKLSIEPGKERSITTPTHLGFGFYSKQVGRTRKHKLSIEQGKGRSITRRTISFRQGFRLWFGNIHEWVSVLLIFLTLAIAVYSLEQAKWITPQPPLTLVLGLVILTSLLLLKSRLPDKATCFLIMVLGAIVAVWQSSVLLGSPETTSKSNNLMTTLHSWWQAVSTGQPNEGIIHFAIFLIFVTWITGFVSTWFILRRQNVWIAVSLGTIIIIVNLSNLPKEHYYFFILYSLAAMLLIGQSSLAREHRWFKRYGSNYPYRGMLYFTALVISLSALIVSSAWFIPEIQVNRSVSIINTKTPWVKNMEKHWLNLFAAVPAKWDTIRSSEQGKLSFSAPLDYGDEIQFVITSEQPMYWRTRRYDTYHSWGWTSSTVTDQALNPGTPATKNEALLDRQELTYIVENKLKTDVLLTAGEFVSSNIPVLLQTLSVTADNKSVSQTASLVAPSSRVSQISDASLNFNGETGDVVSVITPQLLRPYQRYTVAASVASATLDGLFQAEGNDDQQRVAELYLQLPSSLPERVRQISQELTREAETPYDIVAIIKDYLRQFKYNKEVGTPPESVDGVDHFIFEQREGVCTDFASAMVVMLRSAGIPARLCAGYLHGKLDDTTGNFIIRARDFHVWPEVYLYGYGWVEMEVTPVSENERGEIDEVGDATNIYDWMEEDEEELFGGSTTSGTITPTRWGLSTPIYVVGILLFLTFALGLFIYRWLKRFKKVEGAYAVYAKMCFLASLAKSGPDPQETPLEYCSRLALILPLQAEAIGNIAQAYVESRFSQRKETGWMQKGKLYQSWRDVYLTLIKRLLHLRR